MSLLDPGQIIKQVHDESNEALKVNIVASDVAASTSTAINDGTDNTQKATVSATGALKVDGSAVTQPVSAASLPLPTGAATEATASALNAKVTACDTDSVTIVNGSGVAAVNVQDGGNSLTVDGTVAATQSGVWNVTNVSGTVSLPTGASTEATLAALEAKVTACDTGDVTVSNGAGASAVNIQDGGNSITVDGTVTIQDGGGTITVDGTVAATQSGAWNIGDVSGTVSLPTGASTEATLAAASAKLPSSLGQKTGANSMSVVIASDNTVATSQALNSSSSSSVTSVAASASSVSLLASTAGRKGAYFYNDSTSVAYLKFGATASTSSFTVKIQPDGFYEMPTRPVYTGAIDCIWASANGNMRITELS